MKKTLIQFFAFGCLGITTEIFFTAFTDLFNAMGSGAIDWSLTGKSYVWMFPIYGSAALFIPPLWQHLSKLHLAVRILLYVVGIYAIEFSTGWALEMITGKCPWEYTTGWHILGYIRLDFAPAWAVFGFMLETAYQWLEKATAD